MASKRTLEILEKLDEVYTTEYKCYLNHENPGQLLIATMLSAQTTDKRVNSVTNILFEKYNILKEIKNNGHFKITAKQINEYREPRLMTKFDNSANLPELFNDSE